ncbi:hypothetical protein TSOC_015082 [Tetrabaena socialis]|uniref:Uncharacterized protein n=1 Tax=Tetrabaena socialis TaxID=47790 RepID=A0A2J7ZFU4_9CHLO|nr:hypothetical protein TSOC_015082 [Tetrabaena socialis]|eukprot:PNG99145.1 hypothetical protein TSOC_015082 [Tetrabaena socialis]
MQTPLPAPPYPLSPTHPHWSEVTAFLALASWPSSQGPWTSPSPSIDLSPFGPFHTLPGPPSPRPGPLRPLLLRL